MPDHGLFGLPLGPGQYLTQNGSIRENDTSAWFMTSWDTTIGRVPFRGNIGVRYASTDTVGQGYNYDATAKAVVPVTITNQYHDWLPSVNAVLEPADDFLIRFSAAEVMSRPNLPDLVPGISASKSGTGASIRQRWQRAICVRSGPRTRTCPLNGIIPRARWPRWRSSTSISTP